jgi:hypothetical protein
MSDPLIDREQELCSLHPDIWETSSIIISPPFRTLGAGICVASPESLQAYLHGLGIFTSNWSSLDGKM